MTDTIRTLKLVTGEEVIGTIVNTATESLAETRSEIVLEKVRTIQMGMTAPGHVGVALVPFSAACVDGEIAFNRTSVVAVLNHGREMEDAYLQQTSGIQLASAGSIPRK